MIRTTLENAPGSPSGLAGRVGWWLVAITSLMIASYAGAYVVLGDQLYPAELAASFRARPWGIYTHAFFGMIGLALGPFQFRRRTTEGNPARHRLLGMGYLVAATMVGLSGIYMAIFSYGGIVTNLGFGALGATLLLTSGLAYLRIRRHDVVAHREWMIRSFALLFAAVTLRMELGLLTGMLGDFEPAYRIVSWLCWMPNLVAAELYIRVSRRRGIWPGMAPAAEPGRRVAAAG